MDLAVISIGPPRGSTLRALPEGFLLRETSAADARASAASLNAGRLLFVEPEATVRVQTFLAAAALDPQGGILGGCATESGGWLRFGTIFSAVPYGPFDVEPFALIDASGGRQGMPAADAIDAVCPGVYLVDRRAFLAAGGFDPTLGSPWRVYDLCERLRSAGAVVRWDQQLVFGLDLEGSGAADAVDHRDFVRRWSTHLAARYDLDTPSRGAIRRHLRLPLGQSELVTVPLPATEIVVCGNGEIGTRELRASTRVTPASIRDVRGDDAAAIGALEAALRVRTDRYLAIVDAGARLDPLWLERMQLDLEWASHVCGVRREGLALLALSRLPSDCRLPGNAAEPFEAIDALLEAARGRGKMVRRLDGSRKPQPPRRRPEEIGLSIAVVAHSRERYHRSSFDWLYNADLAVDYHTVTTPQRPETLAHLRTRPTLDVIVDDSRGLAVGTNAALLRARGDAVVVIGDDFHPPSGWLEMLREAFALRPDAGIIAFSSVYVEGAQLVPDGGYADILAFRAYVSRRRELYRREAKLADRLAALALAVDARALAAVGGFDERLGVGRWGVEDLALRVRAAGYNIYVTQDLFVHRYQPNEAEPFANDPAEEARRAEVFARKWGLKPADVEGFDSTPLIARGFDSERDRIPLRDVESVERELRGGYDAIFVATCADASDLESVAAALGRYMGALKADDAVLFAVGVGGDLDVEIVGARARSLARKTGVPLRDVPDVAIAALKPGFDWLAALPAGPRRRVFDGTGMLRAIEPLEESTPSGFRRALRTLAEARA